MNEPDSGVLAVNAESRTRSPLPLGELAPLASLAAIVLFFSIASEGFLATSTLVQVLKQGSVQAIVAAGLTFVLLCGEIDLAVGMVALWSASLCGWLHEDGLGVVPCVLLPLLSALLLGLVSGTLTVWARLPSFIITLAMMNVAQGASRWLTESSTFTLPKLLETVGNGGWPVAGLFVPYSAMLAVVVMAAGHIVLVHTRFGRYVYMTGGNREAARLAGVRTGLIVIACLAIAAVLAGVGGMINSGRLGSVSQDQNADLLLSAVACVVLGGTSLFGGEGSMPRTVIGVLTFNVLHVGLNRIAWIEEDARPLLMGLVLLSALVINGLLARRK